MLSTAWHQLQHSLFGILTVGAKRAGRVLHRTEMLALLKDYGTVHRSCKIN